ncbi:MAG TPA: acyltransferase [Burkholderiales bacterium]
MSSVLASRDLGGLADATGERGFHIPSLDGIRALAALLVFAGHAGLGHVLPGGFGVTVFFFLSGYLITTLLRREHQLTGGISLKNFYLRRVYRIMPPLYLVLILLTGLWLAGVIEGPVRPEAAAMQYLHLTNYYIVGWGSDVAPVVPYTVPMWSLAVEEHFYLLFPLGLLLLLRTHNYARTAFVLAFVCVAILVWRCTLVFGLDVGSNYVYHATDTRMDSLLFGCVMGLWMNPMLDREPAVGRAGWLALCGLAAALLLASFVYRSNEFRDTLRYTMQGVALFPLFYCAIRFHDAPLFAWLSAWPLRALGLVSYTFYLVHEAAIDIAGDHLGFPVGSLGRGLAGFALAVILSVACYVLVERRFAALRRKLHGKPAAQAV